MGLGDVGGRGLEGWRVSPEKWAFGAARLYDEPMRRTPPALATALALVLGCAGAFSVGSPGDRRALAPANGATDAAAPAPVRGLPAGSDSGSAKGATDATAPAPSGVTSATAPAPSASVASDAARARASDHPSPSTALSAPEAPSSGARRLVCAPPDQGMGAYHAYRQYGRLEVAVPKIRDVPPKGLDLYLHFHFGDAVRRVFVGPGHPMVFAGLDLGEGSEAYKKALSEAGAFDRLVAHVDDALREAYGPKAKVRHVVLSSWSAGFGASMTVLKRHPRRIRGVVLLDSLYAPYAKDERGALREGVVFAPSLKTPLAFARRAARGERFLYLTASSVVTHGYASTGAVFDRLSSELGEEPTPDDDPAPLGAVSHLDVQNLHMRKRRGSTAEAHCAHLGLAAEAVRLLRASGVLEAE